MIISRPYVEKYWLPSIGGRLDKWHFREPPPGTGHAECDPNSEVCELHYDKVNPLQDPLGHLIEDTPETLTGLIIGALAGSIVYEKRKNIFEALLATIIGGLIGYSFAKLFK